MPAFPLIGVKQNLLPRSEQADLWDGFKSGSATANNATDPNGGSTADTITFASADNGFWYQKTGDIGSIAGRTFTYSVWLSSPTKAEIGLRVTGATTGTDQVTSRITLTTTPTRYTLTRAFTSADTIIQAGIENRSAVIAGGAFAAGDVVVWGCQLNEGASAGDYVQTVASAVTSVGGILTQLPFANARRWEIARVIQSSGAQYSYHYHATAFASWELSFVAITDAELTTLRNFFDSMAGGWDEFEFTDPDTATLYSKCCFSDDGMKITHLGPNEYRIALTIEAYT